MIQKWSQAEVITIPNITTKLCVLDGADPENKLLSISSLLSYFSSGGYVLTKSAIESVLTGNITSHTHSNYLTGITKALVENVLTGTISSHGHDISSISNGVSQSQLTTHAENNTHLTPEQLSLLEDLVDFGGLTLAQKAILDLFSIDINNNLVLSTNLIVQGAITAFSLGEDDLFNYDILTEWVDYLPEMTDWVVAAPLIYELYSSNISILTELDLKVENSIQIISGLGLSGGGNLEADVTLSLDINDLSSTTPQLTDLFAIYRPSNVHYKVLLSDLPFSLNTNGVYTPLYSSEEALIGGGLSGGGLLNDNLYLELDIRNLELFSGTLQVDNDLVAIYDSVDEKHKKLSISQLLSFQDIVYTISLPSASTVAGRIASAVEGTDYPAGWTLAVGTSQTDLLITHNLNTRICIVTVFAINGTEEQQLFNTAAFNGIKTPNVNSLLIQSLATIQKAIKIYIIKA